MRGAVCWSSGKPSGRKWGWSWPLSVGLRGEERTHRKVRAGPGPGKWDSLSRSGGDKTHLVPTGATTAALASGF